MTIETRERAREAFLEYRATREPTPLGEVFDLCAQELLLVAHHIAGRGISPEDLVQATFLEAITHAEQYDPRRPIVPWLCGILINVARKQGRAARREFEGWRMEERASEDPAELARAREFVEALRTAIAVFPAPQREALTLRLVHGLTPTQIAHALGRPLGSVKSWLHRGVEELRVLLPAGFAALVASILASETALGAVRERVLEAARAPVDGPPIEATSASSASAWIGGAVGLVVLLGATAWFFLAGSKGGSTPTSPHTATVDATSSPEAVAESERHARTRVPGRDDDDRSASIALVQSLEIRARFAADGAPARIGLRIEARLGADTELRSRFVETDEHGFVRVEGLTAGEHFLVPDRGEARIVVVPGAVEVALEGSLELAGRVLDEARRPIPNACVWLTRSNTLNGGEVVALTDVDGSFELRGIPEDRALAIRAGGFVPSKLFATSSFGTSTHVIVLAPSARAIVGTVLDPKGLPVLGARVCVGDVLPSQWSATHATTHDLFPPTTVETGSDGRFEFDLRALEEAVTVLARAPGTRLFTRRLESDERKLVVQLEAGARWIGLLAAAERPIDLSAVTETARPDAPAWSVPAGRFGAGKFELRGLQSGKNALIAAEDGRERARKFVDALDAGAVRWSPFELAEGPRRGIVRTESGLAVGGVRIDVHGAEARSFTVTADERGVFELELDSLDKRTVSVRGAEGAFDAPIEPSIELDPQAEPFEIIVRDSSLPLWKLSCVVLDVDGNPLPEAYIVRDFDLFAIEGRPGDAGKYEFGPLPDGEYYLCVDGPQGPRIAHGPLAVRRRDIDVGTIREKRSGRSKIRFEGLAGRDAGKVYGSLWSRDGAYGVTIFILENGSGMSWPVPPGSYLLLAAFPEAGLTFRDVEVPDGEKVEHVFGAQRGTPVSLVLHDRDVRPSIRAQVTFRRADGSLAASFTNEYQRDKDARTRTSRWNLAPGTYRLEARAWDGATVSREVVIPASSEPVNVELDLHGPLTQ